MSAIIVGEDYDVVDVQARAKQIVMDNLVRLAERDGVPATMRAMYVRKAAEAQIVLGGGSSYLIEGEASERGIAPVEMAQAVLAMAAQAGDALEVYRARLNVAIEKAATVPEVVDLVTGLGLPFSMVPDP